MYCHKCGTKAVEDYARFCPKCGTPLVMVQTSEEPNEGEMDDPLKVDEPAVNWDNNEPITHDKNLEEAEQTRIAQYKGTRHSFFWPIAVPIMSLMVAGSASAAYYYEQTHVNQEVVSLKIKAEKAALKGKYTESIADLKKASDLRPAYQVLQDDRGKVQLALELEKSLNSISSLLKTQQIEKVDSQIGSFKDSLTKLKGPLSLPFQKQIEEKSTILTVAKIKVEINKLNTVEKLAEKLTALSSLQSPQTDEVKRLIVSKIVDQTTKDAETQLNEKQFSSASSTIDKGLEYASNDTTLMTFKDRIQKEQTAFETAEKQRIHQAMEVAAHEDLANKTAAIVVQNLNSKTDDYGDLHITGEIKNNATVSISSITLYYSLTDLNGNVIGSNFMIVNPYYLDPGQSGSFDSTYYGVNQDVKVQITKSTWQLN